MKESSLPSPGVGSKSMHIRRIVANFISNLQVNERHYINGVVPQAATMLAFLDAARAAVATTAKAIPALTLVTAGGATTVAIAGTLATTLGKDGSDGAVTYTSSNVGRATVNSSGVITGVTAGAVTITANVAEGTLKKAASKSVTVTVA